MERKTAFDAIIEQFAGKAAVSINEILMLMMDCGYTPEEWQEAEIKLIEAQLIVIDNSKCNYSLITIKQPKE